MIGVDILYEYEETLLVCDNQKITSYLEKQFELIGIKTSKKRVED